MKLHALLAHDVKDVIVLQVNYFAAAVYDSMGCLIVYSRKNYHFVTLISLSIC